MLVSRRDFFNPRYPKNLMTLELFYSSRTCRTNIFLGFLRVAVHCSSGNQYIGDPNEIIRTTPPNLSVNSTTWNPLKQSPKW